MTTAEQVRQAVEGLTIPGLLRRNAQEFPDHPALTSGIGANATTWTWSRLRTEVAALTTGLSALGLKRGDRMLIAMSRRPEHWVADLAAIHIGALPCTTYDTLSTEQIRFVAQHSKATVLVLEGEQQLQKWRPVLGELPHLRAVVTVEPDVRPDPSFVAYSDLRGETDHVDAGFEKLVDQAEPDSPLTVVYTSGTTGDPKGVVLTHRNVIHESLMQDHLVSVPEHPRSVAYLPLAHIAERVLGIYMPTCNAGHVTLCEDQAQLLPTLAAVRPNGFFGVPRVWEKLATGLQAKLTTLPTEQAESIEKAREVALEVFRLRSAGEDVPADLARRYQQVDDVALRPIRWAVGLDDCRRAFSGAAPIPTAVLEFLASLGLPVYEVWGLSETTGAATVSTPEVFALGSVGQPGPGVEVRVAEDGELVTRGPVVFAGYLQEDGTISPATDADGWLPTGDIGTVDDRGIVRITDRKKEIIITAGGKNIAPTKIESLLRAHPLVGQAVAIGDERRYVTALLVLDEEAAPAWAKSHGIDTTDLDELAAHPEVHAALEESVAQANGHLARVEQVKTFRVLAGPWTAESGELTPKLSLRRKVVAERYAAIIEGMYA
ncbi:long-chain fatty acid--CoA ligase [Saccharopolyspora rhizosphaerae]|uniref:Acyl-CoA synthetase n=1 Tax=Saccharopolyspora rhizosphaerae TaxID=2492662 RepID=A0A3R8QZD0_9PSEU|nr:AMP-dependent synthetase/ligase [Saccharopolyspora rhizosphaerae]RRO14462.1 long-chain fatty acid--CoA ligase [Saccharopolyspora rhizosphaerae]